MTVPAATASTASGSRENGSVCAKPTSLPLSTNASSASWSSSFSWRVKPPAYTPTNEVKDGGYRKVEIKLANKDLKAQARKGYYAIKTDTK